MAPVLVLELGGGSVRLGFAGHEPRIEPNCRGEPWPRGAAAYGQEVYGLGSCRLRRPLRRGLLLDLELQRRILEPVLARLDKEGHDLRRCQALVVLAPLTPELVAQELLALLVEDLGLLEASWVDSSAVALKSWGLARQPRPCSTVLHLGFSACFAQPCIEGKAIASAGRRMPVGGRVLTNLLLDGSTRIGQCCGGVRQSLRWKFFRRA